MKNIRKYTLSGMALFLLLCFSASIIPADFFHEHRINTENAVSCKVAGGQTCQHKSHLGKRVSFCWACTFHVDKTFINPEGINFSFYKPSLLKKISTESSRFYQSDIVYQSLRGPPAPLI